jgi:hypothetical protein
MYIIRIYIDTYRSFADFIDGDDYEVREGNLSITKEGKGVAYYPFGEWKIIVDEACLGKHRK